MTPGASVLLAGALLLARAVGVPCLVGGQVRDSGSPAQDSALRHPPPAFDTLRAAARPRADELRERIEDLRRRRMAEYLDLTESQSHSLERRLEELRRRQRAAHRERERLLAELRREVEGEGKADEPALRRRLDALRRTEEDRERALREFHAALSRELTAEQRARLQLFAERFQGRMAEGIRQLRERRGNVPR
ncbi:MAG: hypothetical protein H0V09_09125 [Gemmatimonadetes bacterium]|nr:hypothetical protein [Gemmatimonadota bacterium]